MPLKFKRSFLERKTGGCSGSLFISIKGEEIYEEECTRTEKDIDMCIYSYIRIFIRREGAAERHSERKNAKRMSGKEGE